MSPSALSLLRYSSSSTVWRSVLLQISSLESCMQTRSRSPKSSSQAERSSYHLLADHPGWGTIITVREMMDQQELRVVLKLTSLCMQTKWQTQHVGHGVWCHDVAMCKLSRF